MSEVHIPDLSPCESIDILVLIYTLCDRIAIDMTREGRLDDDAVYFFISREIQYGTLELCLSDCNREFVQSESHSHFTCSLLLHPDIGE